MELDAGGCETLGIVRVRGDASARTRLTRDPAVTLTTEDLKDLGVVIVGHRRTMLDCRAIAELNAGDEGPPPA